MQEQRVTKEQAIRLKKAGFDWETDDWFHTDHNSFYSIEVGKKQAFHNWNSIEGGINIRFSAPTLSDAVRFLREVKGWHLWALPALSFPNQWDYVVFSMDQWKRTNTIDMPFPTHDTALSAGIDAVLEQIEKEVENG